MSRVMGGWGTYGLPLLGEQLPQHPGETTREHSGYNIGTGDMKDCMELWRYVHMCGIGRSHISTHAQCMCNLVLRSPPSLPLFFPPFPFLPPPLLTPPPPTPSLHSSLPFPLPRFLPPPSSSSSAPTYQPSSRLGLSLCLLGFLLLFLDRLLREGLTLSTASQKVEHQTSNKHTFENERRG